MVKTINRNNLITEGGRLASLFCNLAARQLPACINREHRNQPLNDHPMTNQEIAEKIKDSVKVTVIAEREDHSYRNVPYYDEELKKAFAEMVKKYGLWGWCQVEVKVQYKDLEASDYLGGCSYKGQRDFVKNSGYYDDMVSTAILEIAEQIAAVINDPNLV